MKLFVAFVSCLFCAASAAVTKLNWFQRAVGKVGDRKPDRPKGPAPADVSQGKQSVCDPVSWRFPDPPPEEAPRFPPDLELKVPPAAESVAVICGANSIRVEAKKDLPGIGKLVRPEAVTLGDCPATGEDEEAQVLVFESELHRCGSQLLMSEDSFTYAFTLHYNPSPLEGSPIIRTAGAAVRIGCRYQRKQVVSSASLKHNWMPFSATKASEESLHFSLRLMTDDWRSPRPSSQFQLGDVMRFEVAVKPFHHAPLRVMVDRCVATVVPNVDTVPRYTFLGHNGCLFDSRLTGSSSRFLQRSQDNKLQFELDSFRFQQDDRGVIYITCSLRATPAADATVDGASKACSFSNGWREASGRHGACACCDTHCGTGSPVPPARTRARWDQETAVGPVVVEEKRLRGGQLAQKSHNNGHRTNQAVEILPTWLS
ncbi:zona pellucida sperm-binding protein 3-like [Brachionichthys hirsutus]|uniref:zona pellucida sperm-binding protein 3-like n=1 Tax=Brachionichthys hirsutus TaxID=412623 RepID=UPI003604B98F